LLQPFAVHAGEILTQLVGAHFGIKAMHISNVGMTPGAEVREEGFFRNSPETLGRAHSAHGRIVGVPAVTVRAGQSGLMMNVAIVELGRFHQPGIPEQSMAGDAGVLAGIRRRGAQRADYHQERCKRSFHGDPRSQQGLPPPPRLPPPAFPQIRPRYLKDNSERTIM
jgi:hypothetical protein